MKRPKILFLTALTILVACNRDAETHEPTALADEATSTQGETSTGEGSSESTGTDLEAPDLAGNWLSPCFDQGDGTFANLDFDLAADEWALDYTVHGDEACMVPLVSVHIEGPYTLEQPSAVDGAWEAVFAFDTKTITPHAPPLVEALDGAGCGTDPWAVGVTQSIAQGCAAFGQYPLKSCAADYDIVALDGDTLRFGARPADNDMCTPAKRPAELSPLAMARQ